MVKISLKEKSIYVFSKNIESINVPNDGSSCIIYFMPNAKRNALVVPFKVALDVINQIEEEKYVSN